MSDYSVYLSNGTWLVDLIPSRVDTTSTSLSLQGDFVVPKFGQLDPTNLVHLMECFANTTPPANPLVGQLWYNPALGTVGVWSGTAWTQQFGPTGPTGPTGPIGLTGVIGLTGPTGATGATGAAGGSGAGGGVGPTGPPGPLTTSFTTIAASGQITSDTNIAAGAGASGGGYLSKAGMVGAYTGNVFNLDWTGAAVAMWIDTSNVGNITLVSDGRHKHHITPMADGALSRILQLKPISHRWQNNGIFIDDGLDHDSLIAQEVLAIIPSAVTIGTDQDATLSLNALPLISTLIKAVQELTMKVAALEVNS
jgi:hypothetical protein